MTQRHDGSAGIGIDVGGTSTRLVVFEGDGRVAHESAGATPSGPTALVRHLVDIIAAAFDVVDERPPSIGIGIPGGVHNGVVTNALNLGIVDPLPLADVLTDHFSVPVTLENDVNAAALGAWSRLESTWPTPLRSMTYLSIGTGFAAGTIVDGTVIRGGRGLAGEIGHIPFPHDNTVCACGQRGCIETVVSGQALVARMSAVGLTGTAIDLWNAADRGHPSAEAMRDEFVDALAWSSQLAGMLLDVDSIVIGGGVGIALGDLLVDRVIARLVERQDAAPLLASIALSRRVVTAPADVELGALGAHLAARTAAASHLLA
jgi:glucokinase